MVAIKEKSFHIYKEQPNMPPTDEQPMHLMPPKEASIAR